MAERNIEVLKVRVWGWGIFPLWVMPRGTLSTLRCP